MRYVYLTCMIVVTINYIAASAESNFIENDSSLSDSGEDVRLFIKRLDKRLREMENEKLMELLNDDHYMMRKSQRSPSLRLRFGRSSPNPDVLRILKLKNPVQYNQNQGY